VRNIEVDGYPRAEHTTPSGYKYATDANVQVRYTSSVTGSDLAFVTQTLLLSAAQACELAIELAVAAEKADGNSEAGLSLLAAMLRDVLPKKTAATGALAGDGQVGDGSTSEARGSSATTVAPESPAQGETDTSVRPENRGDSVHLLTGWPPDQAEPAHVLTGSGLARTACGEAREGAVVTTVPEQVTCSGCLPTAQAGIPYGCTCDWMNTGYPSGAPDCPHHGAKVVSRG